MKYGPFKLFDQVHSTLKLIEAKIDLTNKEQVQSVLAVAGGSQEPSADGPAVFAFLKTAVLKGQYTPL